MTTIERDDPRLRFQHIDEQVGAGETRTLTECWWCHDPERGLLLWRFAHTGLAPQCNANRQIAESVQKTLYPWAEVVFVNHVTVPARGF